MQAQLRRYRIRSGHLEEFAAVWRDVVVPLREQFGFRASGWVAPDTDEFIWVLEHEDRESFERADTAYYASDARKAVDPDPARLVEEAVHTWVTTVA